MKIACLSGKGGAGKTWLAVHLALAAGKAAYIDCDVEEPNGRIFLKPRILGQEAVCTLLPQFDTERCSGCKKCVEFCSFHALTCIRGRISVFPSLCHSCGGCALLCPEGAVTEVHRQVGHIEIGERGDLRVVTGVLNVGEASGMAVIRQALSHAQGLSVIDCPPGSACGVMECAQRADFCLLVAEPTAFGLHNLQMVHELVRLLGKPCAAVINKAHEPYEPLERYCAQTQLPIWERFAYSSEIAARTAAGETSSEDGLLQEKFRRLLTQLGGGQ